GGPRLPGEEDEWAAEEDGAGGVAVGAEHGEFVPQALELLPRNPPGQCPRAQPRLLVVQLGVQCLELTDGLDRATRRRCRRSRRWWRGRARRGGRGAAPPGRGAR